MGTLCSLSGPCSPTLRFTGARGPAQPGSWCGHNSEEQRESLSPQLRLDSGLAVVGMDGGQAVNTQCDVGN